MARHFPSFGLLGLFLCCFWSSVVAQGVVNVTIDDFDTRNIYTPRNEWLSVRSASTSRRYQGSTSYTKTLGASVSFTFTNTTKLYWISFGVDTISPAFWPITLNGQPFEADGHRDTSERDQAIVWVSPDLNPATQYTVTVTKTNATQEYDLNIDGWILTQPIPTGVEEEQVAQSSGGGNNGAKTTAIVGGVLGAIIFILAALLLFFFLKVRRLQQAPPTTKEAISEPPRWSGAPPATGFIHGQASTANGAWSHPSASPPINSSHSGVVPYILPPHVAVPHSPTLAESTTTTSGPSFTRDKPSAYRQPSTPTASSPLSPPMSSPTPAPAYIP